MEWTDKQVKALLSRHVPSGAVTQFMDNFLMESTPFKPIPSEVDMELIFAPGGPPRYIPPSGLAGDDDEFNTTTFAPLGKGLIDPHMVGAKLDAGKNRLGLVLGAFAKALFGVGEIGTFGANKYTDNGWKSVEDGINRYTDALLRHLFSHLSGEKCDPETGKPHLWHAAWNILAIIELTEKEDAGKRRVP